MAIKYIHVNQHVIRANKKHNANDPVLTIKEGKKNTYAHTVQIHGPSTVITVQIHGPSTVIYGGNDKPVLSCGARVVIKTEAELTID